MQVNIFHYSSSLSLTCPQFHHIEHTGTQGPRQVGLVLVSLDCRGQQPPTTLSQLSCPFTFPREEVVLRFVSVSQEGRGEWEEEKEGHNQPSCLENMVISCLSCVVGHRRISLGLENLAGVSLP